MKCRYKYKEPMECFYLTKDNYEEFLDKYYFDFYMNDYIITEKNNNHIKIKVDGYGYYVFYFNQYYIYENYDMKHYTKEQFEEKFEVIN